MWAIFRMQQRVGRVASTYIGTDRPWLSGSQTISIAIFQQSSNKRPGLIHPRRLISGEPASRNLGGPLVCLGLVA